jgi:3,4-dihydroxy 2-butanone 4-phosphate synthase/GTP cyclohydrolase II
VTLVAKDAVRLGLTELRSTGGDDNPVSTAFMDSVDARHGITTGISASDRAKTIQVMASSETKADDLVRPGHMFPIKANPKGVLGRAGHTEASVDLAHLSGRAPLGVICEIMKDDGTMARLTDLIGFAQVHGLKISSVAELIRYRSAREGRVVNEANITLPTKFGSFQCKIFESSLDGKEHLALWTGDLQGDTPPMVRVHSECLTGDVLGSLRCDCGDQLDFCMKQIQEEGRGILLYMRQEGRGIGLVAKMKAYELQEEGMDTVEANLSLGYGADQREYRSSALMLKELGVTSIRLMTNNPAKVEGLEANGIEVAERIPVLIEGNGYNVQYLETKRTRMGHIL